MKFCTLFSGSSGNAIFVSSETTKILVDAGVSGAKIEKALLEIGEDINEIKAIFVTHEHGDHIMGVGVLSRRYGIPVYSMAATLREIKDQGLFKKLSDDNIRMLQNRGQIIGDLSVRAFDISHDAVCPVGYVISETGNSSKSLAIVTDTGVITDTIKKSVLGTRAVILEANHDIARLEFGPYPYPLKMRIKSEFGHLSNDDAARFALELTGSGTKNIVLGHLSPENNIPELAFETVNAVMKIHGVSDIKLSVAPRFSPSEIFEV